MTSGPRLVLLVGHDNAERRSIASRLVDRGRAVVICSGPPGCSLVRDDHCALLDSADLVVLLPSLPMAREVVVGLALCARLAHKTVVAGRAWAEALPPGSVVTDEVAPDALVDVIDGALTSSRAS